MSKMRGKNRGTGAKSVVITVACFTLALGGLWFSLDRINSTSESSRTRTEPAEKQQKEKQAAPATSNEPVQFAQTPAQKPVVQKTAEPVLTARQNVSAQLAAGEFNAALNTVADTTDVQEQTRLLKQIADAQMALGDFAAAHRTIQRIPDRLARSRARGENAKEQSLAGGGSMADFTQLKDLIKSSSDENTLWEEDDGEGGTMEEYPSGVRVDPNGLLYRLTRQEQDGRLAMLGTQARKADLNADMIQKSSLRLVSLTRLEKEISKRLAEGEPVLETMKHLAGLTKIQYVFIYPEEQEIIIGGPAEGWQFTEQGNPVGVASNRPTLQLDDFVTMLRTFSPGGTGIFQCLIKPRQEGLKQVNNFVQQSNARGPLAKGGSRGFAQQLENRLGLQDVVVQGIPLDSRAARVIVEADYRMKLIGIDKLDAGKEIPSYFDLLAKSFSSAPASMNALRWWLTMKYDSLPHSADRNVFEMVGSSVQCQSEDEAVDAKGNRIHTGQSGPINRLFAQNFSDHYDDLAKQDPVFADLQNVFDLALVAALIRHERADQRIGWGQGVFASKGDYNTEQYAPAAEVMSVVNHRVYKGKEVVVQVAGGVRGDLMAVVKNNKMYREKPELKNVAKRSKASNLPAGRWWWDAAK